MSTENKFFSTTIKAGANFSSTHQHKAVTVGGTVAAAPGTAIGLLKSKPASGEHGQVGWLGEMKAYAGGAINSGTAVTVTTSGFIIAYTGVASGGTLPVGRALEQAASGDLFRGLFNFANGV